MLKTVEENLDVIMVIPPRASILPEVLDNIINFGADQIVYIYFNPKG